jgi:hypothetical protein
MKMLTTFESFCNRITEINNLGKNIEKPIDVFDTKPQDKYLDPKPVN